MPEGMSGAFRTLNPKEVTEILLDIGRSAGQDHRAEFFNDTQTYDELIEYLTEFDNYKRSLGLEKTDMLSRQDMGKARGNFVESLKKQKGLVKEAVVEEKLKREVAEKAAREAAEDAADAAAKKLALQQTTKESAKQIGKNIGKGALRAGGKLLGVAGGLAAAPAAATALTAAEIADIAIDFGAGGDEAKVGRDLVFGGPRAAYEKWAATQPVDRVLPTYDEYVDYKLAESKTPQSKPAEEMRGHLGLKMDQL
jgi:hypothetical protein